jgi:predicted dehydrogenase
MSGIVDVGIVGLGWWGERLIDAVQGKSDRIRFVHGVNRNPEAKRALAERHQLRLSADLAVMLADPRVQAVVLATPHSLHRQQIEAVAASGKPVFCEKPLTLTRGDAVASVEACRAAGIVLAVGHNRRFWPGLAELKRLLASGDLGEVLHVEGHFSNENSQSAFAAWRHADGESPAGGMTGTGIHVLDAFVSLVGPVRSVHAQLVQRKPAPAPVDSLSVLLTFENDITGVLSAVRATPRYWRTHVFGTARSAELLNETDLVLHAAGETPRRSSFAPVDSLRLELEAFAEAVVGRAPYPIGDADMVATVAAFEAICRSLKTGRTQTVENG